MFYRPPKTDICKEGENLNCPNCGAPITQEKCPYCGTMFWDFSSIDPDRENRIKLKLKNKVVWLTVKIREISIRDDSEPTCYWADNIPLKVYHEPDYRIVAEFEVVKDNGILYAVKKLEGEEG